jgi:hypothetical protein
VPKFRSKFKPVELRIKKLGETEGRSGTPNLDPHPLFKHGTAPTLTSDITIELAVKIIMKT